MYLFVRLCVCAYTLVDSNAMQPSHEELISQNKALRKANETQVALGKQQALHNKEMEEKMAVFMVSCIQKPFG